MTDTCAQMALLRQRFRVRAGADRAAMLTALEQRDRERLLYLVHGLAGIAGIFGYADVSAHAQIVEAAIDSGEDDEAIADLVATLIGMLEAISVED